MFMNKKIIIIITTVLALVAVFVLLGKTQVKYITKPVTQETITQYVEASGTIKPINTIAVGTQVSGTVAGIYVDYNSVVKKGDLLAELDPSLFQSNVDQSTAKLNNAKASLSKATSSLNYKKNNYQRYKNLYAKNYVSKDEVELAFANYQQALAEVEAYCNRSVDYELEMVAEKIAIIKLNRLNSEGLSAQSYSGVSETYIDGYPADIMAVLNRKRKIKVV